MKWHNGQEWNSQLSPENNRRLLPSNEIIEEWKFFNDPMSDYLEPWKESWIPLLTNDSGDYVVYETSGPQNGNLIAYWHDWEDRSIEYQLLIEWAESLLKECEDDA